MNGRSPAASPRQPFSLAKLILVAARAGALAWTASFACLMAGAGAASAQTITRSVTLGWTSPGNDGNIGTASSYSVRYSNSLITEANWASAIAIAGAPVPQPAGTTQSMTAGGFSPGQTYYFGLKTVDLAGNWSALSNVFGVQMPAIQPFIQNCSPGIASALSTAPLTVTGSDFQSPDSMWLQRSGARIVATAVSTPSAIQVTGNVALSGASTGYWDLVVKNPDGKADTLASAVFVLEPAPTLSLILPNAGIVGNVVAISNLMGTNFTAPDSVFFQQGATRLVGTNVTVVSSTRLSLNVNLAGAPTGFYNVRVKNPDGQSDTLLGAFNVNPPTSAPSVTALNPNIGLQGASLNGVQVSGTHFSGPDSVFLVQGATRLVATAVNTASTSSITFNVSLAGAPVGSYSATVKNADGQSSTLASAFTVQAALAAPTVSAVLPAVGLRDASFGVQVSGTGFTAPDSVYAASGATRIALTGVSNSGSNQIGAQLNLAGAPTGLYSITVKNPDGQSGFLGSAIQVVNPGITPTIASLNPSSASRGQVIGNFQIAGTGFSSPDSVILVQGARRVVASPVWAQSSSQLSCVLDLGGAWSGTYDVQVKNGDGLGATKAGAFTVFPAAPVVASMAPGTAPQGAPVTGALLTGQYFWAPDSIVLVSGGTRLAATSVQLLYPTLLSFNLDLTLAPAGSYDVRVINPDGLADTLLQALLVSGTSFPTPALNSISPITGPGNTSLPVSFFGAHLTGTPTMELRRSGRPAIAATGVTLVSPNQATGTFNLNGAESGAWDAFLANPDNQSVALLGAFTVLAPAAPPVIVSISPISATRDQTSLPLFLSGSGFVAPDSVWISSGSARRVAAPVTVATPNQIQATLDLTGLAAGIYDVSVKNPGGLADTLVASLTLVDPDVVAGGLASITPSVGSRGTVVHISALRGTNFISPDTVWLSRPVSGGRIPMTVLVRTSTTQITGDFNLVGAALGIWNVVLRNGDGHVHSLVGGFEVQAPPPTLISVNPASGRRNAPASLSLAGRNLQGPSGARLHGGTQDIVLSNMATPSDSSASGVADIRGVATGSYDVILSNSDGQSDTLLSAFTVRRPKPLVAGLSAASALNVTHDLALGLRGSGLDPEDSVALVRGSVRIAGTGPFVSGDSLLTAHFSLFGAATGTWVVEVRNGEGEVEQSHNFQVTAVQGPGIATVNPAEACLLDSVLVAVTSARGEAYARPESLWIQRAGVRRYARTSPVDTLPGLWLMRGWVRLNGLTAGDWDAGLTDSVGVSGTAAGAIRLANPSYSAQDFRPVRSLRRGEMSEDSVVVSNTGPCPLVLHARVTGAWLQVSPDSLEVAPGASLSFRLTISAVGLARGRFAGRLDVSAGGGAAPALDLPESLQVLAPVLTLQPSFAHGHALAGRAGDGVILAISNTGDAPLHFSATSGLAWSAWSSAVGVVPAGQSFQETVHFEAGSLSAGQYSGAILLASDDSLHPSVQIPDTLDVAALPDTSSGLSCDSLEVHASVGPEGDGAQALLLRNHTDAALAWAVPRRVGWIRLQFYAGQIGTGSAGAVSMTFDFTGFASGDYRDTLVFQWGADSTRWLRLPVRVAYTAGDASPLLCPDSPTARWNGALAEIYWTVSADLRVSRYHIYRREPPLAFVGLGFVRADSTVLFDATADTSHAYIYRVSPVDIHGLENAACSEVRLDPRGAASAASLLAYPNPFAGSLRVRVDVPASLGTSAAVRVRVIDAGGHVVRTLLDETRSAGRYVLDWDSRNGLGQPVVAGLYRVQLEINGQRLGSQWLARRWTP